MWRWALKFAVICLLSILGGCAGRTESGLHQTGAEQVNLRIAWWGNEYRNNATIQVIQRYEEQNPHVNIEYDYSAFNEYWKKLAPSAAGNVLPDIIQMDLSYLSEYGTLGLLEDLSPYVDNGWIDTGSISDDKLAGGKLGEQLYGVTLGLNALFSMYDPEVLKAYGLQPPDASWTWDDLETMGQKLKGTGIYLGTYLTPEQFFAYSLRQQGVSLFTKDGSSLGYQDDGLFVEYFGRMQRLMQDKLLFEPDIWTQDINDPDEDPFYKGQALFGWGYSNQFISTVQRYGKPLAIAPMPGPHNERGLFLKPSMFFSVAKNSKHKEEAARFINFFVNDLEANKLLKGERGVPVSSAIKEQLMPFVEPELAQVFDYVEWVEQHSSPMDPPGPIGTAEVTSVLREIYDLIMFNKMTPQKAAEEFRLRANGILSQNLQ
ncbi:ABC transporter substrate-binding protein [Paenibacillus donghaensis]|uniref:Sugar ABC transporter substrate-binding protein n=1 Tax=Paenibacillus donghaensis TaxID=414771 RepID=A0A2Z2KN25_9BACL|nr:extracellular solute-binding protein [Paenibacillus donghaensis]ASA20128.1 sugar ABC transporter substrate-binding protein [Paenibacillus donghaensis]